MLTKVARTDYNRFSKWKVLAHQDRLREIAAGRIPNPVEWVIYPSNVCGYKCGHCIMAKEHVDHRMMLSKDAMMKIPGDAKRNGVKCVIFSGGGDPLLNKHTLAAAEGLKRVGIRVGINNQGYLLDDPRPFDFVRFSVDAATPETYQRIHRVPKADGWRRVNENIDRVAALRAKGCQIELGLAFLITPTNWNEAEMFCHWAQLFEPDFVHIRPAYLDAAYIQKEYPMGGDLLKSEIVPQLQETAKRMESQYSNVYFRVDKFDGYWSKKLYSKCRANTLLAVTSGDGAFLICQDRGISKEEEYLRWGDYNTQSFEKIWQSDEHRKVMDAIDLDKCPRCVENGMNEIIEHCVINDSLKMDLL